jgi:tRNA threonylcarbamoyl adenosine modification protein YjeE
LEGELGAGKSTFAAAVLEGLGADRPPEGSPTFSLVHRYPLKRGGEVLHIDLYRLKSEGEIEAAGILEDLWNLDAIVLVEWLSMWPGVEEPLLEESSAAARRRFRVNLALSQDGDPLTRSLQVERL